VAGHDGFFQILSGINSVMLRSGNNGAASASNWSIETASFGWNTLQFRLCSGAIKYIVEYRNHYSHEAICVNGNEVCRGGNASKAHQLFKFFVANEVGPSTCVVEPHYSLSSRILTGRLTSAKVMVDGQMLPGISRSTIRRLN
jgi:hypothetical protein